MKSVAIQSAINVMKMKSWETAADFRYQDETSEFKIGCDQAAARKVGKVYVPKPWEGLPYLAKDDLGRVHVRGFLHDLVAKNPDGTFSHPASLSTPDIIQRLSKAWKSHGRQYPETRISHQRLVFSMSKEFHDAILQAGRSPDMVLRGVVERTMRSFAEKFHPGDSVGFSYGLHHDTDNLHAHVFIHPRTRAGDFVGMSGKPKHHRGHDSRHKDQLGFVHLTVRRRVTQVLKELSDPKEAGHLRNHLSSDRIYYAPRQSHTSRARNDFRPRTPVDYQLEQKRAAVVSLDRKIAVKRSALRDVYARGVLPPLLRYRQPKWMRHLQAAQAASLWRELRQLQTHRHRLVTDYWTSRRRLIPAAHATRTVLPRKKPKTPTPPVPPHAVKPTIKPLKPKPSAKPRRGF